MPATKQKKRVKVRAITGIASATGAAAPKKSINAEYTALSEAQKKKIGKAASKRYEQYRPQMVQAVADFVQELQRSGLSPLKAKAAGAKLREQLQSAFIEGAASSHKTTIQRVTTAARAKKSNRADKYAEIRKEFKKHSKRPKTEALSRTAQSMNTSVATVRRALG